jgi:hypothetical protein
MLGTKHLIECRCILPTYKKSNNPPIHKFIVFSVTDQDNNTIEKIAQCNNCGIIHKVTGYCKSEILHSQEEAKNILTVEDVSLSLPPDVREILKSYNADLPTHEQVQFMIATEQVGSFTILDSESDDVIYSGKLLRYEGRGRFSIEPFQTQARVE